MEHGLSCSAARGIFLDQGSNTSPLHWEVDFMLAESPVCVCVCACVCVCERERERERERELGQV